MFFRESNRSTALKTLSLRLRSTKVELEEMGEDAEGAATSTAKLRANLLGLTGGKVDIMADETTFKNTTQILREMSAVWDEMDDISRAGALELMGGKRQANILSSLITNFETVEQVIETSANSAGSALEENKKYLESIQGHIDILTNSLQTMWNNTLNSGVLKFFIDIANILIKIVDNVGLLKVVFGALAGYFTFKSFDKETGIFALFNKIPALQNGITSLAGKLGLGTKATALFGSALSGLASVGIGLAIAAIWKIGDAAIKTAKEIKESAKEAVDSYNSVQEKISESKTLINDIRDDYRYLALGVDDFGNNINLTTSEYERYNEIVNQIADMFPDMVRGYTAEGNAIIKNKGNVEALTAAYETLSKTANDAIIAKAADIMKDYKYTTEGGFWQWDDSTPRGIKAAKELEQVLQKQDTYDFSLFNGDRMNEARETIISLLGEAGISQEWNETNAEYVKRAVSKFPGIVQSIINTWNSTVNTAVSNVKPLVQAYLDTSVGYEGLTDQQKNVMNAVASSFDSEFFSKFEGDAVKMQQAIEKMILNIRSSGIDDEYSLVLSARTEFNNNQVTAGEYQKTVHDFVSELERLESEGILDENDTKYIKMSIGINVDEDAEIDTLIAHAQKLFAKSAPKFQELQEKVLTLNYSDLKVIDSDVFDVSSGTLNSWQQLIDAIERAKIAATQDFTAANFADYGTSIESITENISTLQSAYESLMSGDFTYEDFLELVQQFPELADGVDASSDSFKGLAKNLRKAIKNAPDDLVDELKDLRSQLVKAGKSTNAIDQLIDSMENMPADKIDELAEKYVTLADVIEDANQAQGELAEAMEENPNANYENTSEAVQKMRDMYANGAYGSESEIWDIFEALTGQTYDFTKSLTENKDVLKDWINTYSGFYLSQEGDNEDGEYAHEPIEKFLNFMEDKIKEAKKSGEEWAEATTWTYENGTLDIDYENRYLEDLAEAAGLTEAAFHDLMMQVAQFWAMEWEDADDIVYYMNEVLKSAKESGENADEVLKDLANAMDYFNKGDVDLANRPTVVFNEQNFNSWAQHYREILSESQRYTEEYVKSTKETLDALYSGDSTATVFSHTYYKSDFMELGEGDEDAAIVVTPILPDGSVLSPSELEGYAKQLLNGEEIDLSDGITLGIFKGEDFKKEAAEFAQELHNAQEIYYDAKERFSAIDIILQIDEGGTEALDQIEEISGSISRGVSGDIFIDTESLTQALTEAQYTESAIVDVINKLHELDGVTLYDSESDPFGLYKATSSAEEMINALDRAGIAVEEHFGSDGGINSYTYHIDVREMSEVLASRGWTTNDIVEYINSATGTYTDGTIFADMSINVDATDIDEALGKVDTLPEDANTDYTINVNPTFKAINDEWAKLTTDKKVDYIVNKKTVYSWGWDFANGTANAQGTAFAGGNWGSKKTETALTGELGRELVVRGDRWFTVGDNGAEFTRIKKGDIIFNHRQTEQLLSNGRINGRGKAYASGTAYSIADGFNDFDNNAKDISYKGDLSDTAGDIKDMTKEVIDFIEIKLEEIESIISKSAAKLELLKDDTSQTKYKDQIYNQLVNAEKEKASTYWQAYYAYSQKANELLKSVPYEYRNLAKNGGIEIKDFIDVGDSETNQKIAEAINEYREWATKADDAETGYYESLQQQTAYRLEQIEDIADDFDNLIQVVNAEATLLQSEMDLVTESGGRLSKNHYDRLIELKEAELDKKEKEKEQLQKELKKAVKSGDIEIGTDEWYQAIDIIASVDDEIVQCQIDMEKFSNEIQNIKWDNLDRLIERFDSLESELSHLYDRFTDNDKVVDELGEWTDEGIAAMGVLAQQMEVAQTKSQQYADAIDDLNKNWKKDGYSQDEYHEKLAELTEQQWESIEAYEDAKDKLVDLNKTRVDAVKDGLKKELDAYKELIEKKKEALDAEKDIYDFEKNVQKQQKDIATLERKLAALSGDTSLSAAAQRKQLEAELAEAKAELEDTYYERSIDQQKEALDKESENYEQSIKDKEEELDKYLKDTEKVVLDSINTVKNNTTIVLQEISAISKQYGIDISSSITQPWKDGSNAVDGYQNSFKNLSSSFVEELQKIIDQEKELQKQADKTAKAVAKSVSERIDEYTDEDEYEIDDDKPSKSEQAQQPTLPSVNQEPSKPVTQPEEQKKAAPTKGASVTVKTTATHFSAKSGNKKMKSYVPGSTYTVYQVSGNEVLIGRNGVYTGWVKLTDLQGYAKGTTGVKNSQFAWIDEVGEELVLHAGNDGKLAYLTKGTSVIPSDITNKLLDLVVDPTQTLENSRPIVNAPHIVNNEINIDASIGEVIHIDSVSNDTLPNLEKVIDKQMDKYMKNLNSQIRKYSR